MKIFVTMKSLAKRKNFLTKMEIYLSRNPATLRELLEEIVKIKIQKLSEKQVAVNLATFLTIKEIDLQAERGKVGFSFIYNEKKVDKKEAIQTALQAFEDGLFKVFHNEEEQTELDAALNLQDDDELTFIKLTMLAGRMW
ncbi:hypothetical protein [Neobacillus cucumis]|uniref:hypothetical protein n=1 Tax=Neobacillus cucumis TaxID=1740721 RepID=UPI0019634024|nr:hypothetical protein [Neobacillus cucumis]MBM7650994.1 hypothetical protein [Neobacillus cucumis]